MDGIGAIGAIGPDGARGAIGAVPVAAARGVIDQRATFHVTSAVAATSASAPAKSTPRIDAITRRRVAAA